MENENKDSLALTIVQGDIKSGAIAANLDYYGQKISGGPLSDLWLLPETFATGFSAVASQTAGQDGETVLEWMKSTAARYHTAICGSVLVREGDKTYNRLYLVEASGRVQQYDKRHLFSYGGEGRHISSGCSRALWEFSGWKILPIVCYDLRFPVWARNDRYYDLMLCAASWPESRIAAWDTLLRARAIENMAYVAASNRVGRDESGSVFSGHSAVLTPLGKSLTGETNTNETILSTSISRARIKTIRDKYGFLEDRDGFTVEI